MNELKELIGIDGMVAFEHGFRRPSFKKDGYKYTVNMVSDKVAYCIKHFADGSRRTANLPLSSLTDKTVDSLYKSVEKYIEYCKKY